MLTGAESFRVDVFMRKDLGLLRVASKAEGEEGGAFVLAVGRERDLHLLRLLPLTVLYERVKLLNGRAKKIYIIIIIQKKNLSLIEQS